jgi:hypothetical protein
MKFNVGYSGGGYGTRKHVLIFLKIYIIWGNKFGEN